MLIRSIILSAVILGLFACSAESGDVTLKSREDSVAYILGVSWGTRLKNDSLYFDLDILKQGFHDKLYDKELMIEAEAMNTLMTSWQSDMMKKSQQRQMDQIKENKKASDAFLANNANREGVKVTPSGLQYEVLKEGTGKTPTATSNVTVHYHGTTIKGDVFDSSVERDKPATFDLNRVIKGWTEGLQLMKEGAKYKFYIPANLAYGDRQQGDIITPGSTLIFEVELISVNN